MELHLQLHKTIYDFCANFHQLLVQLTQEASASFRRENRFSEPDLSLFPEQADIAAAILELQPIMK